MPRSLPVAIAREIRDLVADDARLGAFARRAAPLLGLFLLLVLVWSAWPAEDPRRDRSGVVMGHDLSQVWVAGRAALAGRGAQAYDLARHGAALAAEFGPDAPLFGWHYPPVFLLPAAALAALPYLAAVPLWGALSLGLFAGALRLATGRRDATIVALAHPLVLLCLSYGQNGLVTAALLTAGLAVLDRRPALAGIAFGLACYKPQVAALAPLLCLLTGRWRCLGAAAATVAALVAASLLLFGAAPWAAFLGSLPVTRDLILRDAGAGLDLNASAFGAVRLLGGPMAAAYAAQAASAFAALCLLVPAWRGAGDARLRASLTLMAAPLVSPYVPVYDLATLVPASALLCLAAAGRGGLLASERAFLLAGFVATLALRALTEASGLPLGFALAAAGFALVLRRTASSGRRAERGDHPVPAPMQTPAWRGAAR